MSADSIDRASRRIRRGEVQLFLNGRLEWLPAADEALTLLLGVLSNAVWHEETNHEAVLSPVLREAVEALAEAINVDGAP